jgi:tetratricopeptide (TPR) repeat protein
VKSAVVLLAAAVLAGCASVPPSAPAVPVDTAAAVATVRAAGRVGDTELEVRPLADPGVADLREQAVAHEAAGRREQALAALDEALALSPGDPALLQERAELALLTGEWEQALDFARRSHLAGPGVGPLCRRQHELQVQVALAQALQGDAMASARADVARRARDACTVTPPPRY